MKSRAPAILVIFAISLSLIWALSHFARPNAAEGVYFQEWSADFMMQNLRSKDLREHPVQSIWYMHVRKPLVDIARAALIRTMIDPSVSDAELALRLDRLTYTLWMFVFALMNVIVYLFLRRLTSPGVAFWAALAWVFHPGAVYFATFLEGTIVTSTFTLWLFYELDRARKNEGSILGLIAASLLLYFTHVSVTWPPYVLIFAVLCFAGRRRRDVAVFVIAALLVIGAYNLKQGHLYGLYSGSSSAQGRHLCAWMSYTPSEETEARIGREVTYKYPKDIDRYFSDPFNKEEEFKKCVVYKQAFLEKIKAEPHTMASNLLSNFANNLHYFFKPTSRYPNHELIINGRPNIVVELIPWRDLYDLLFSGIPMLAFLLFALSYWAAGARERARSGGVLSLAPEALIGFIFMMFVSVCLLAGNIGIVTESDRYKFHFEPLMYVFVVAQGYRFLTALKRTA